MTMSHLKQLAALAPDLPLGQAVPVLEWISGMLGPAVPGAQTPDAGASIATTMTHALPAPAPEVVASGAGDELTRGRWTEAEEDLAWKLKNEGLTARQIAMQLGRPFTATEMKLKAIKADRMSRALGAHGTDRHGKRLQQPPWSQDEIETAMQLRASGASYAEIGTQLGRSAKATEVAMGRERRARAKAAQMSTPPEEPHADARTDGQAPDATDPADLGRLDECAAGGTGPAPAEDADPARDADVPGVDPGGIAEGAAQQPAGHGAVVSLDVADAPRLEPAPVTGAPEPAWLRDPSLTVRQHDLLQHMRCLSRDDFTPQDDLFLVEELAKGTPGNIIADQLGCDLKLAARRFRSLQTEDIVNAKGILTIDGQADLLVAVRHRARHA